MPAHCLSPAAAKFSTPVQYICDLDFRSASKKHKLQLDGTGPLLWPTTQPVVSTPKVAGITNPDACAVLF